MADLKAYPNYDPKKPLIDWGAIISRITTGKGDIFPQVDYGTRASATITPEVKTRVPGGGGGGGAWAEDIANPAPVENINDQQYNGGGAVTESKYKDTRASQDATQMSLDSLSEADRNGLAGITSAFQALMQKYGNEESMNKKTYDDQTLANEQTRVNTRQAANIAAAQGSRGLKGSLASLGSLDGTGSMLANRAVADGANRDIGEGDKVFGSNATQLNAAWDSTLADQEARRREAEATRDNEIANHGQDIAKNRQSLYEKMAGFKADAGDQAGADDYTLRAGGLAPQTINPLAKSAKYAPRDIAYEGGKLGSYIGGVNDMTVKTAGGAAGGMPALNSPLYALTRRRDKELV